MAGGADRPTVLAIVNEQIQDGQQGASTLGEAVVTALETRGYRVVRAGMVPNLEQLEQTVDALTAAEAIGLDVGATDIGDNRNTVRSLTELAVAVLGLDPDDRDGDGTQ